MRPVEQGLLYWKPGEDVRMIASRVSEDSPLRPREHLALVNSVAVSQRNGNVYFTSSTDVPPQYMHGVYLPMKSVQLATMLVRSRKAYIGVFHGGCRWGRKICDAHRQCKETQPVAMTARQICLTHCTCVCSSSWVRIACVQFMLSKRRANTQGRQTGILLEYEPQSRRIRCLADGAWFANGVALPKDGSYVLFVDTMRMRLLKLWLHGPKVRIAQRCSA